MTLSASGRVFTTDRAIHAFQIQHYLALIYPTAPTVFCTGIAYLTGDWTNFSYNHIAVCAIESRLETFQETLYPQVLIFLPVLSSSIESIYGRIQCAANSTSVKVGSYLGARSAHHISPGQSLSEAYITKKPSNIYHAESGLVDWGMWPGTAVWMPMTALETAYTDTVVVHQT